MKSFVLYVLLIPIVFLKMLQHTKPEKSQQLTASISYNSLQNDGPYVLYHDSVVVISYINETEGINSVVTDTFLLNEKSNLELKVPADRMGDWFTLHLKKSFQKEKSEYKKVKKQLVISDIEGNFTAFKKLLIVGGVIDENYNWIFGDGHLVLAGDFFDRGNQVTQILWLIYSLEEKAEAAGGYVHFILGNHEIMNLSGDFRYVQQKYFENAALLKKNYNQLYDQQSELGRWLQTKNIVQKVGNVLYAHGGFSSAINNLELSAAGINAKARPFYTDTTFLYPTTEVELLFSELGPFWYRGYYWGNVKATQAQIDSSLHLFHADFIITGHTIVADTISALFNRKVFNTDVHHAKGHSEALFIDKNRFYRITSSGERFLLAE